MKRKILTLLLALAMVLTMLPMTALAAEGNVAEVNGQGYSTLQAAINAVQTAGTVKLLENVTESVTIPADATITLDLNGKTLVNSAVAQGSTVPDAERKHTITNNGTLTITGNGTVDNISNARAAVKNNVGGTVTIENGTFCRSAEASIDASNGGGNSYYVIDNQGTMTVKDGTFLFSETNSGKFSSLIHNGWYDGNQNNTKAEASLTIHGGDFTKAQGGLITVKNDDYGNLTITGGTFTQPVDNYYCIFNYHKANISGGTINGTVGCGGDALLNADIGSLTIGGTVSVNGKVRKDTSLGNPDISVTGGTFTEEVDKELLDESINAVLVTDDGGKTSYTYFASMDEAVQAAEGTEGSVSNPKANGEKVQVTLHSGFNRADTFVYAEPGTSFKLPSLSNEGYYVNTGWWYGSTFYAVGESYTVPSGVGDSVTLKAAWSYNGPVTVVTPSEPAVNPFNENAGKNSVKFSDVADNAWYASAVNYAVDKGLMNGTGEGKFSPEAATTRGMIVTILARLDGKNTSGTPWYQAGQRWAMEYEISDGTNMTGVITREQLVAMLFRYAVKNGLEAVTLSENLTQFTDASDISAWAVSAMQWAVGQGLIQGSNGQLRPQANASRAEVATILMRFCELLNK